MTNPPKIDSPETGPYLSAALICENVLVEKDNIHSIIRMSERIVVQALGAEAPEIMPPFFRDVVVFLAFKSGQAVGPVSITITLTRPSGLTDSGPIWQGTLHFEGGTRGHNLTLRARPRLEHPGPYWFNVYVGDRIVSKIPLEIIYTFTRTSGLPPAAPRP